MQFRETSDGLQKCANFVLIPGMLIGAVLKTSKHRNLQQFCIKQLFAAILEYCQTGFEHDEIQLDKKNQVETCRNIYVDTHNTLFKGTKTLQGE